jgi:hypothetical protein
MATGGGFVIDSEWYWRIFEGSARFEADAGATAARDFLHPLAGLAREHVVIDHIEIVGDGDGVQFRVADYPVAIACRGLRIERFVDAINRGLAAARLDLAFAIVESRRYELRGVLVPRDDVRLRSFARGTMPP